VDTALYGFRLPSLLYCPTFFQSPVNGELPQDLPPSSILKLAARVSSLLPPRPLSTGVLPLSPSYGIRFFPSCGRRVNPTLSPRFGVSPPFFPFRNHLSLRSWMPLFFSTPPFFFVLADSFSFLPPSFALQGATVAS